MDARRVSTLLVCRRPAFRRRQLRVRQSSAPPVRSSSLSSEFIYTEIVEENLFDDGMGSRAHAHGEVKRVTIDTIVQWRRGETHGPIACAWIANEDHEWRWPRDSGQCHEKYSPRRAQPAGEPASRRVGGRRIGQRERDRK